MQGYSLSYAITNIYTKEKENLCYLAKLINCWSIPGKKWIGP